MSSLRLSFREHLVLFHSPFSAWLDLHAVTNTQLIVHSQYATAIGPVDMYLPYMTSAKWRSIMSLRAQLLQVDVTMLSG